MLTRAETTLRYGDALSALERCIELAKAAGDMLLARDLTAQRRAVARSLDRADERARQLAELEESASASWTPDSVFTLELPIRTFSEANARGHWGKRYKQSGDQRPVTAMAMRAHVRALSTRLTLPCVVQLTRLAPCELDVGDNLDGSMKHIRDGIADYLGVNDRDPRVQWPRVLQEPAKAYGVRIEVRR